MGLLMFVLFLVIHNSDGMKCLKCDGVISPRHCHTIENCADNMVCMVERYRNHNSEVLYNIGCRAKAHCNFANSSESRSRLHQERAHGSILTSCLECCHGNLCNSAGCGESGFPANRGPVCLHCPQSRDTSTCDTISICDVDEKCQIEVQLEFGEQFYSTSCVFQKVCDYHVTDPIFGKRSSLQTTCSQCCNTDLCNDKCKHLNISLPTETRSTEGLSAIPTTSETTLPTTTLQPVINKGQGGTEFYFTFPQNAAIDSNLYLVIYITSNSKNNIKVQVHTSNSSTTYTFTRSLTVPMNRSIQLLDNRIEDKGIRITSNDTIQVTGYSDYNSDYSDAFNVIPSDELGISYIVASYHPYSSNRPSFAAILPIYSDTTVWIALNTTTSITYNGHTYNSGDRFEIYLKQYHSFQLSHDKDLTGTRIDSDKAIAVQSGCSIVSLPVFSDTAYILFLPPISSFGSTFILPSFPLANKTSVRVIPLDNSTSLAIQGFNSTRNYRLTRTLEIDMPQSNAALLICTKPCLVAAYSYYMIPRYSFFMTILPALSQYSYNYTYITPQQGRKFSHHLSIFVKSSDVGGITINNNIIFSYSLITQTVMVNNTSWSVLSVQLSRGTYSISSTIQGSKYGVIAYGLRVQSSYAYPLGLQLN